MTERQVERLTLATPDLRHRAAFVTACGTGLRVSVERLFADLTEKRIRHGIHRSTVELEQAIAAS